MPKKTWTAYQREILFRKNSGKLMLGKYLEKLSHFFATPVQAERCLDLEKTDSIVKRERAILQEQQWISTSRHEVLELYQGWGYMSAPEMLVFMQAILDKQNGWIYWYDDSDCCGLYQVSGEKINLDYDFSLHKPDCIVFYPADESSSLCLEYLHDEVFYSSPYHIRASLVECTYRIYQF